MASSFQGLLAILVFWLLVAAAVLATWAIKQATGERRSEVQAMTICLIVFGTLLVARDWRALGPTVALQSSSLAAALAWLLVAPLGLADFAVMRWWPQVGFAALSLAVAVAVQAAVPRFECTASLAAGLLVMFASTHANSLFVDQLGTVLAFVAVFCVARKAITLRRIEHWSDAVQLDPASEEFREKRDFFAAACIPWANKYDFQLEIVGIYRLGGASTGMPMWNNARHLFHGTSWEAAQGIVLDGFRLPDHPGMFGKGVYFADCPLKSWQYTRSLGDRMLCCQRGGLILMCLVDLGEQRRERQANTGLTGYDRSGWWAWLTREHGAYDSVVGLEKGRGGALRVPEYVIYDPCKARVDYILEVQKCRGPAE